MTHLPTINETEIPASDFALIKDFAGGNKDLRDQCIDIHRKYLRRFGVCGTRAMRFMAEVDSPCPDPNLRNRYARELLEVRPLKFDLKRMKTEHWRDLVHQRAVYELKDSLLKEGIVEEVYGRTVKISGKWLNRGDIISLEKWE